jgi:hypothetical protein
MNPKKLAATLAAILGISNRGKIQPAIIRCEYARSRLQVKKFYGAPALTARETQNQASDRNQRRSLLQEKFEMRPDWGACMGEIAHRRRGKGWCGVIVVSVTVLELEALTFRRSQTDEKL